MTTSNHFSGVFNTNAVERLLKSADSLDFALASAGSKKPSAAALSARPAAADFGSLEAVFGVSDITATLFDDWLANDLHHVGFMNTSDEPALSSSASDSDSSNSPRISNESDSPIVGFDSIASDAELIQSVGLDASSMALFPEAASVSAALSAAAPAVSSVAQPLALDLGAAVIPTTTAAPSPLFPLTPEAVQQAAAALNIPWSKGLEEAVLAQSLLASIPMALALPVRQPVVSLASTPSTSAPLSPSPALLPRQTISLSERAASPVSPISPSSPVMPALAPATAAATPRALPILSTPSTANSSVKATTYKSAYRSTSLSTERRCGLKRERQDEPPSVLDGRDLADMDEVSLKRAKNTDAARRSRHKKLVKMEGLEQRVAELEIENSMFEAKLNEVELERSLLADKDHMQQARIQELERMLASLREKLF